MDSEAKVDGEDTFNLPSSVLSEQFFCSRGLVQCFCDDNYIGRLKMFYATAEKEISFFFFFFTVYPHISFPLFIVADRWAFTPIH